MAIKISGNTVIDDSRNITSSGTMSANAYIGDGSQLTNLPGGGNVLTATASGTLADGSKVIVNADGTVSVVAPVETTGPGLGTPEVFHSTTTYYASATFDSTNNRVVITYQGNGYGRAVVGTVSGTSISFGTPVVFKSDSTTDISATFDSSNGKIVVVYRDSGNSGRGTARVGTVSGTSISFGSESVFRYADSNTMSATFDSTNNKVVIAFRDQGNGGVGTAVVGTVSGTSISFGSYTAFESNQTERISATFDSSNGKVVIAYNDSINQKGEAVVGTVSGTSISFGSSVQYNSNDSGFVSAVYDSANQKVVIAYRDAGNSYYGTAIVGTVSGTSISFGSEVLFKSGRADEISATYDSTNGKVVITYSNPGNSDYGTLVVGTVSGTSISFGSDTVFESATTYFIGATFDSSNGKVVIAYSDYGNSYYGTAIVFSNTGFSIPQIGSAEIFHSTSSNMHKSGATFDSTNGKVVIAYRDVGNSNSGTAVIGTVSGTSISFGTPVVFDTSGLPARFASVVYDSANQKIVIAYNSDETRGRVVVGEVSGTSISFGSTAIFEFGNAESISAVYDSSNQRVVFAYWDDQDSDYGKAIVGEVSGTSVNFGSPVTFESADVGHISAVYDSANNKVVIAYEDNGNNQYGTAIVGTVSGNSISFGSPTVFETSAIYNLSATYDSTNSKVVITYTGPSDYGWAAVGTVSGTSISFGSPVVYNSFTTGFSSATFDSTNGKVVIIFNDGGNSGYGTAVVGTVSGTSISFGSPFVFESAATYHMTLTFDSTNGKVVTAHADAGNSYYGTSVVLSPLTMGTNLTAENFIGISDGAYSNGQTATIQLAGSVDDAQSGLTPGSKYYVQNNGTLSTTADDPSVFAGTAVATTKLIVKN